VVGIVVVCHSRALARAAVDFAREMAPGPLRIEVAAGLDEETFGTDASAIAEAVGAADDGDGVVILMDLGSAVLSADLALELLGDDVGERVRLSPAPLVEGLLAAAVAASGGATADEIVAESAAALAGKQSQLGAAPDPEPTGAQTAPDEVPVGGDAEPVTACFAVLNRHGLHARPAARLVREARRFDADIRVRNLTTQSEPVAASSLSRLATLGALRGHELEVAATGPQADEAVRDLVSLASRAFDEAEPSEPSGDDASPATPGSAAPATEQSREPTVPQRGDRLLGTAAAPGIGVGPAWFLDTATITIPDTAASDLATERRHLRRALEVVEQSIEHLVDRPGPAPDDESAIFEAHLMLVRDPELSSDAERRIEEGRSAPAAWAAVIADTEHAFATMTDPYLRARAADVRAVGNQVLHALLGTSGGTLSGHGVLVAPDLTPGEAAQLDPAQVVAVVLAAGSPTSHAAVLARGRGVPVVTGVGSEALRIPPGTELGVDGRSGEVDVAPAPSRLAQLRRQAEEADRAQTKARAAASRPAITRDNLEITVGANIGSLADARAAGELGADLAGLVRTEFLFMDRDAAPDVEEQTSTYLALAEAMGGRRLTLRTLDVGGDKPLSYMTVPDAANPFLGVRGLRLSLLRPELLRDQLRAIVRVARETPVSVMFPMVSTVTELVAARRLLDEVLDSEAAQPTGLEVGIMVEVPAVAHKAAAFAPLVDFFSIGTNDLTQYALAAERGNTDVAGIADPFDPGVLALIRATCAETGAGSTGTGASGAWASAGPGAALAGPVANGASPHVAVCGDLAADPRAVPLLVGLGVAMLSVAPPAVPLVKQAVREVDGSHAADLATTALSLPGPAEVRALLDQDQRPLRRPTAG
jgi:multiphosphoryl transfer protein